MARKENDLTCFALTQQLDPEYWDWTDAEAQALETAKATGDAGPMLEVIRTRLWSGGMETEEGYAIVHNKDAREVWDELACRLVVELKPAHVHAVVKFKPKKGGTIAAIAKVVGVEPQYIEKAGKGRYGYDNLLSYLIHAKDQDKAQYEPKAVASMPGGKGYMGHYMERREEWAKGRAAKARKEAEEGIDELEAKILEGTVTKSQVVLTDRYYSIYARNKRRCDEAFEIYGERRAYKTIQAMQDGEFRLTVFFITGQAGAGKTRFAKAFVDALAKASATVYGEQWRVCQTAATNPLDDYMGEEILFMDDVRGGAMSASDWLKLLDPYNISPASARYRNKVPACRCVVITSSKEPLEFFYYCKQIGGDRSEALDQFMRRIQAKVEVVRADEWAAPEFRIADGVRTEPKAFPVAGSGGGLVTLTYGFGNERVMEWSEALAYLLEKVDENSGLIEKRRQEAEAAAAAEAAADVEAWGDAPAP